MPFIKRANQHQTHLEDLVLLGSDGIDELNDKIEGFIDRLENDTNRLNLTTKIDGSPAVIMWAKFPGYPDNSIALKSFVNNANNVMSSNKDIDEKYGSRPGMSEMLKYCLQIAKSIPSGEAWQGDCLFTRGTKREEEINGKEYITFQPNKIIYAFSEDNPGYNDVKNADFGIAFHTVYTGDVNNKNQSFGVDISKLNLPNNVYLLSPALNLKFEDNEINLDELKNEYNELISLEHNLITNPQYEELVNNKIFMGYWNTFENANLADKKAVTINENTFINDLKDYIKTKKTKEYDTKVSKLKTDAGKANALTKYELELQELISVIDTNKEVLIDLVKVLNKASEIKMLMWNLFKNVKQDYDTFYLSKTKGHLPASMEGVAMSDQDGNIVKIVDRSTFSSYNRDPDIAGGWERDLQEGFNRLLESVDKKAVVSFGRMNPPTIGHKKLVDKMASLSTNEKPKLYLSHSQDKNKNPLDYETKLKFVTKAFGDKVDVINSHARTLLNALHELYEQGYSNIIFVVGGDREKDIRNLVLKYNGNDILDNNNYYLFDNIEFENAGVRNIDSDDISERASASLAREYVKENDFESFKEIVPFNEEDAKELFNLIADNFGFGSVAITEVLFKGDEIYKHNGKYLTSVINYILTNKKIILGDKGDREVNLSDFLTPEIELKLKELSDNQTGDLVSQFNSIMAPANIRWTNIYKGIHSGYSGEKSAGPGIGAETELKSDKKIQELLNLVEPYLEDKYDREIEHIELNNIEHTGGANSKRGVDFETLFNVSGLYDGVTSGPSTSDKIADVIYKVNLTFDDGEVVEEPIYISVKEGPTVSPINLGLSRTDDDIIIKSLTNNLTDKEEQLMKKVIGLRGTTIPGVTAINNSTKEELKLWYYKLGQDKLDVEKFKNAIINSYGNNYYYYHKQRGNIEFKPVEEIIDRLKSNSVSNADLTITQSRIVVQFNLGELYCRLFIRRKGSTSLYLLTEVLEGNRSPIQFKGTEITDLNDYEFEY